MSVTSADVDVEKSRFFGISNTGENRHRYNTILDIHTESCLTMSSLHCVVSIALINEVLRSISSKVRSHTVTFG